MTAEDKVTRQKNSAIKFDIKRGHRILKCIFLLNKWNKTQKIIGIIIGITLKDICTRSCRGDFEACWKRSEAAEASHTQHLGSIQVDLSGKLYNS